MTSGDIIGLVLSYVYAFGMLFIVESIGRRLEWPLFVTRKLVHIGAGLWIWAILFFFDNWTFGIIPFATFIVLNYIFYRQQSFSAMDDEESTPGTVYFAISITILFALLWRTGDGAIDRVPIAAAGVMAMTIGDAFASLIGRRYGKNEYTFFGHTRTYEGSAAFLILAFFAVFLTLWLSSGSALSPNSPPIPIGTALIMALVGTLVGAVAEGISPAGTDNLSVPLAVALALFLLSLVLV
ncbi:MAG: phosphatidate cytidylyltransferase [Chloroflexi bacterium]|nr:phosphatidate cytidylyltransferase [Chloroflexota bacterium]